MTVHPKVSQFIAFCESKDPELDYDWDSSQYCALGRFNSFDSNGWHEDFSVCNDIAAQRPRTFGALTRRLREAYFGNGLAVIQHKMFEDHARYLAATRMVPLPRGVRFIEICAYDG